MQTAHSTGRRGRASCLPCRLILLVSVWSVTPACGTIKHMVKAIEQAADTNRTVTEGFGQMVTAIGEMAVKALGIVISLLILRRTNRIALAVKRGYGWARSRWPWLGSRGSGIGG